MEMFRIIAAAIAFLICTYEGYRKNRELKNRVEFLAETLTLLERFSIGIKYSASTADELLERENGRFAELVKSFKSASGNTRSAWESACGALPQKLPETALLRELGASFGTSDTDGTLKLLESCKTEILTLKSAAENEFSKRGKATFQIGTLCGIGAAILII